MPHRCKTITLAALLLTAAIGGCIAPPAMKQGDHPRAGRPLKQRICVVYSSRYLISSGGLEKLHPFDIHKYAKIYLQLVNEGLICPMDVYVPEEIARADLLRVHTREYLDRRLKQPHLLARYLEYGLAAITPAGLTDAAVLQPFRRATGGTLLAARLALQHGMAINLGGGYHHAEPGKGGGFCIYADMPVAIRMLQAEGLIQRALVVDLDVHQGNGTALCFENDETVYTFDMHEAGIYPIPKEHNDLDVPLPAGTDDAKYHAILAKHLSGAFDQARPDIVFLQAGVDVLSGDPLANLEMTIDGVVRRDAMVFEEANQRFIPIVMVLGGGYSKHAWFAQYRSIADIVTRYSQPRNLTLEQCSSTVSPLKKSPKYPKR